MSGGPPMNPLFRLAAMIIPLPTGRPSRPATVPVIRDVGVSTRGMLMSLSS